MNCKYFTYQFQHCCI